MGSSENVVVKAFEGVRLSVPASWRRSALVVLSNGGEDENAASIAMRRETLDPRVGILEYMDNLLIECARTVPRFVLLKRSQRSLCNRPAGELTYTLTMKGIEYEQTSINVLDRPGSVLSIIASAPQARMQEHRQILDDMIASIVLEMEEHGSRG